LNWQQLRTVLWLRWRLSRNQWSRGGELNAVLLALLAALGVAAAVAGLVGGAYVGSHALATVSPLVMLLIWDVIVGMFLFFWMIGIVAEIQRSEAIDISKLLHLPISVKEVFLLNYVASHFTLSIILVLPAMLGLSAGLSWQLGGPMPLMFPLVASFIFMITAWTYCLRGWLVALMVNKRRRRAIIVGVTMAAIVIGQLPNLIFNNGYMRDQRRRQAEMSRDQSPKTGASESGSVPPAVLAAHAYLPPIWIAKGAMSLRGGDPWPAVWGSLGAFLIGGIGLLRAYRVTVRFYQGGASDTAPAKRSVRANAIGDAKGRKRLLVERALPGIPEEAAALTLTFLRSLLRAPEVKMALFTPLIMLGVLGSMRLSRGAGISSDVSQAFTVTGTVGFTLFGMIQVMSNLFGFDRDGFRALVLLPVRRHYILLAKNLALSPLALGAGLIFLVLVTLIRHLPLNHLIAGVFQLISAFLLACMVGNFVSIRAPYRIAQGSLKPTKTSSKTTLLVFLLHLLFPLAMLPVLLPAVLDLLLSKFGAGSGWPVNLLASLVLVISTAFAYRFSLAALGELLQRREKEILAVVTQEVE
jgi:ABC-2 type transport system permease protein